MGNLSFADLILDLHDTGKLANESVDHLGNSAPDKSLIKQAWDFFKGQQNSVAAVDEDEVRRAAEAQRALSGGHLDVPASSGYLGAGAAMQTLMDLYKVSGGQQGASAASIPSGFSVQGLMDKAMKNAARTYDQQASAGRVAQGSTKQDTVNQSVKMIAQFLSKSQGQSQGSSLLGGAASLLGGGGGGGSSLASLGSLVSLVGKFM